MRRIHFVWTYLVLSCVLLLYGSFNLIYDASKGKGLSILALVFTCVGGVMSLVFLVLYLIDFFNKKKKETNAIEKPIKEVEVKETPKEEKVEEKKEVPQEVKKSEPRKQVNYVSRSSSYSIYDRDTSTVYVKQVGYGPVLRVEANRILDMRNNTYYTIEGNVVYLNGSGPVFEINGDRIRMFAGSYLYELSGSNINKVFGGFFASISGNYMQIYDLSAKFEFSGSLNKKQILAITALLFGAY